jgi:exocyst complex component 3
VEAGDRILQGKGKETTFKTRAIESIRRGIDKKFEDRLKDQKEAIMVLELSKFTATDLILVLDHTVKCFPKHYEVFDLFESQYKLNIEKRIMPFLQDEEEVKKSYGTLISLLNWVDSYDDLLSRLGVKEDSYVALRSTVKSYMPFFLEHI